MIFLQVVETCRRRSSCAHPKGFAVIKKLHPDIILWIQEAELVIRESMYFHAAGLTSSLQVNNLPPHTHTSTTPCLQYGGWNFDCHRCVWRKLGAEKKLEHWKSSEHNSEHYRKSGRIKRGGRRKPGQLRELRTAGECWRPWSIRKHRRLAMLGSLGELEISLRGCPQAFPVSLEIILSPCSLNMTLHNTDTNLTSTFTKQPQWCQHQNVDRNGFIFWS